MIGKQEESGSGQLEHEMGSHCRWHPSYREQVNLYLEWWVRRIARELLGNETQ